MQNNYFIKKWIGVWFKILFDPPSPHQPPVAGRLLHCISQPNLWFFKIGFFKIISSFSTHSSQQRTMPPPSPSSQLLGFVFRASHRLPCTRAWPSRVRCLALTYWRVDLIRRTKTPHNSPPPCPPPLLLFFELFLYFSIVHLLTRTIWALGTLFVLEILFMLFLLYLVYSVSL